LRMRLPESSSAFGLLSLVFLCPAPLFAQDLEGEVVDTAVDSLVEDAWSSRSAIVTAMDEPEGDVLELSLEAARAIALTNDLRLQSRQEIVDAARHRELGSWGAFDWIFNASANISDSDTDARAFYDTDPIESNSQDVSFGFDRAFSFGGSLSVSYSHNNTSTNANFYSLDTFNQDVLAAVYSRPLMRGAGGDYATSLQGVAGLRWSREQESYRLSRQGVLVDVDVLYWDLALAERQMSVAGSALDLALEQLDRDQRRRAAGVATEVEVIQDEATVARRIEGVLFAETNLRSAMDLLRSTLFPGVDVGTWSVQLKSVTPLPLPDGSSLYADWQAEIEASLPRRGEVRIAEIDLEIAEMQHERAVSERQPLLDLLVQISSQGFDGTVSGAVDEALGYDFPAVSAGLNFQLPVGNVALDREERAARAELRAAHLNLDAQRSDVARSLREALRRVRYQSEATRAASKTRESAERLMEAERSRYEQGLSTNFQVLEFQQALVEAQYAEQASRAAYGQSLARLAGEQGVAGESQGGEAP
jgi:outer membrane protein TolC